MTGHAHLLVARLLVRVMLVVMQTIIGWAFRADSSSRSDIRLHRHVHIHR